MARNSFVVDYMHASDNLELPVIARIYISILKIQ